MSKLLKIVVCSQLLQLFVSPVVTSEDMVWTTSNFIDFAAGSFGDGGENTYIAANGTVRLINLWDLNNDGNFDLPVSCGQDHDERVELFIYWADEEGYAPDRKTRLPTEGAFGAAAVDLNGDNQLDIVVANVFDGENTDLDTYIYWGDEQGYDAANRDALPAKAGRAVAAADLNRDGHVDLVVANQGVDYHMVYDRFQKSYIYWGSKDGFSPKRRDSLATINCTGVKIKDVNQDGHLDVLFSNEGNIEAESGVMIYFGDTSGTFSTDRRDQLPGIYTAALETVDLNGDGYDDIVLANSYRLARKMDPPTGNKVATYRVNSFIYWGSPSGFDTQRRTELPTIGAVAIATGDLDSDGLLDLVFANSAEGVSFVYWNGPDGFTAYRRTQIPAPQARGCVISDLNRDGYNDLILANYAADGFFDTQSFVYWGGSDGLLDKRRTELPTSGAAAVIAADLNGDQLEEIVFINKIEGVSYPGGTTSAIATPGPTTSWIYWGDDRGRFDPNRRQGLPTRRGASGYTNCDLNADGYVDLLFADGYGATVIYWGSFTGFTPDNRTPIPDATAGASRAADFNRDGYLDVILNSSVLYGQKSGFSKVNRFVFAPGVHYPALADLNKDGWLDVVASNRNRMTIFLNGPGGFDNARKVVTEYEGKDGGVAKIADLNRDGHLDIVVIHQTDELKSIGPGEAPVHHGNPYTVCYIYYGGDDGYSEARRQELPSVGATSGTAADFNADGTIDLFFSSYLAGVHRHYPGYLYWNQDGFDAGRRQLIPAFSGCGTFAADCDLDGYPELFVANHTRVGNHRSDVWVYRGGPDGYSPERRESLPAAGPHFFSLVDPGNVYDRSGRYDYVSPAFDAGAGAEFRSLRWKAETPHHTKVEFQVRTSSSKDGLDRAVWQGPDGENSYYFKSGQALTPQGSTGSWIQYKATLVSPNDANTPILESVSVSYRR